MSVTETEIALQQLPTRSGPPSLSDSTATSSRPLHNVEDEENVERSQIELKPVDRGRDAWLFVASAFVLECMLWGFCYSFGSVQTYLSTHPVLDTQDALETGLSGTIALGLLFASMLVLFSVFARWPESVFISIRIGLVCTVLSLFLSSFASSVWMMILLQGIGFGVGGGVLYAPSVVWLFEWFVQRRSLATGLIFAGGSLGGTIFPLILGKLFDTLGFANAIRVWAGITGVTCSLALLGLKPRLPLPPKNAPRPPLIPRDRSFLSSPVFWAALAVILIQGLGYLSVSLYISTFAVSLGYNESLGQLSLSVFNACALLGQLCAGYISDHQPWTLVMAASATFCAITALLLWGFANSITLVLLFAGAFAFGGGGFSSIWGSAASEVAQKSPPLAGIVFSLFGVAKGVAAVAGPVIAGSLHDPDAARSVYGGQGFTKMVVFVGATMVAAACGSLATQFIRVRTKSD